MVKSSQSQSQSQSHRHDQNPPSVNKYLCMAIWKWTRKQKSSVYVQGQIIDAFISKLCEKSWRIEL